MSRTDDRLLGLDEVMRDQARLLCGDPEQYLATIRRAALLGDPGAIRWLQGEPYDPDEDDEE